MKFVVKSVVKSLVIILPFMLISCSYLSKATFSQNKDKSYMAAKSIPPLNVPPGLSSDGFNNKYPVSGKQYPTSVQDVSIYPPGLND
jgi:uncharacterized lipoprotein